MPPPAVAVLGDPRGGASDQMNARSLRSLPFLFSASGPGKPVPSATNKNAPIKSGTFISSAGLTIQFSNHFLFDLKRLANLTV